MFHRLPLVVFLLSISLSTARGQLRDGTLFDPGATTSEPAKSAPAQLSRMLYVLGQWNVSYSEYRADTLFRSGSGLAAITLMNRGHAIMERMHCPRCADTLDIDLMSFLAYNTRAKRWNMGEANGLAETISVHSGDLDGDNLILRNAIRRGGGAILTAYQTTYHPEADGFSEERNVSTDFGATWHRLIQKRYTRRVPSDSFLVGSSTYGSPDPNRPKEAAAFDFMIGTFDAPMQLHLPDGRDLSFPSITTAVYALNGKGILEYGWYDVDKNHPDAATSIIRLYNRAMRRWESLYMDNRANAMLFFGGVKDGDRIVLSLFETDLDNGPIQRWVFHDIGKDAYHWYGAQSSDRGKTYSKYWIIDMTRRKE